MSRRKTIEEFINRAISAHGGKYCYDGVVYNDIYTKVSILCPDHGVFEQIPKNHWNGSGCPECGRKKSNTGRIKTTEEFIQDAWCKHGDRYNYKLVIYVNAKTKVKIICSIHGVFEQRPSNHLYGSGCLKCHGIYKERYSINDIPIYDRYIYRLEPYGVECRRSPDDENALEVKCMYCDRWHQPTISSIRSKITSIKGKGGENNLYCSDSCKQDCPTYNQILYPKGFKQGTSREVQPQLRKLVLLRDEYQCVKCQEVDKQLHCHHITGVELNPIESADVDNCITLCIDCHKLAHQQDGCSYNELRKC